MGDNTINGDDELELLLACMQKVPELFKGIEKIIKGSKLVGNGIMLLILLLYILCPFLLLILYVLLFMNDGWHTGIKSIY